MLPARFTTADAAGVEPNIDIAFAVEDAITEPDTFTNIATVGDVDNMPADAPAITEPDTMIGDVVVLMPAAPEPDMSPFTKIGPPVEIIAAPVDPPITLPFTVIDVPEKFIPYLVADTPPVIVPVAVKFPAVCVTPVIPDPAVIFPSIRTFPFVAAITLPAPPESEPPTKLPVTVRVPAEDLLIRFVAEPYPGFAIPNAAAFILKLQLPV